MASSLKSFVEGDRSGWGIVRETLYWAIQQSTIHRWCPCPVCNRPMTRLETEILLRDIRELVRKHGKWNNSTYSNLMDTEKFYISNKMAR